MWKQEQDLEHEHFSNHVLSDTKSKTSHNGKKNNSFNSLRDQLYVCWVLVFFAGSSLGAIFINKTCLTGYHFRYPLTLVLFQMIFAIAILSILHITGYKTMRHAHAKEFGMLALPTALFTCNVVVGLSALSLVNIPMFSAFRRLTLLFVMGAEYLMLKKTHSRAIVHSVIVMTMGAFVSALDDVSFSRLGYCLVLVNNVLTAGYLTCIKRAMRDTKFDALALLYYIAVLGLPFMTTLVLATGELGQVMAAFRTQPELSSWGFAASIFLTASGAFLVNFSTSLCTHVTSALTTSVAGQVKNVFQTVLGFFSWGFVPTALNTAGLLIALGAQIWFAFLKYHENCGEEEVEGCDGADVCSEESVVDEREVLLGKHKREKEERNSARLTEEATR
ncbi:UDP-N-acetylglucosamine/UDP-glucose/GDP-mannose transporter [Gracilariopsis chorda]|uniref:UDP-N-acetylglucosamine/UDP-glucose/GDP-mannose transporter n=1 Tax=Gracilariopsis chorda TaxID=448386 RepID=A0A2V3IVK8_9FLOR|nr:UDP-N-acetylglucosamine/UDP-glucose/GDP-mannose transporter [Gracilariopsis chorda]|eukprot:PXF45170.1 UDP-N-acetylglucosamine/UDP-glucose/GDP-mannose transporter [Gracilariopsis chorda]